jgi:hypothetical protein
MHFQPSKMVIPSKELNFKVVENYTENRDYPAKVGTSRLGVHLRFGTIGIRELARKIINLHETFLHELIWREFYAQILFNFPHVEKNAFRGNYDLIKWRNNTDDFERWTSGKTGFPLVDAGMRELNATGFMHNRVRMLTASFLTKNLLIDDEYTITGNGSGINRKGNAYTLTIQNPLIVKMACKYITQGIIEFVNSKKTLEIDYGNGSCDDDATITINGVTYNIKL